MGGHFSLVHVDSQCALVIHPDTIGVTRGPGGDARDPSTNKIHTKYCVLYSDSVTTYLQDYSDSTRVP